MDPLRSLERGERCQVHGALLLIAGEEGGVAGSIGEQVLADREHAWGDTQVREHQNTVTCVLVKF